MNLTELVHPALAGQDWRRVRWELFVFHDVRDVLATGRPGTLVVVHRGPGRIAEWLAALADARMLDDQPLQASAGRAVGVIPPRHAGPRGPVAASAGGAFAATDDGPPSRPAGR